MLTTHCEKRNMLQPHLTNFPKSVFSTANVIPDTGYGTIMRRKKYWRDKNQEVFKKKKCKFITCIYASLCYLLQYLACNDFYIQILRYCFFVTTPIFEDQTRLSSLD